MGFARAMNRDATMTRPPREYWETNCYAGLSPFVSSMVPLEDLPRDPYEESGFYVSADRAMFGVDYPHFESILPSVPETVDELVGHPAITEAHARKILFENAVEVYRFDVDALAPHVERVGFEIDDRLATSAPG
jgi:hypothetical protein